ncbi:uncharacterized protein B0P05DRAFT_580784 [Gilbertella persicaria]|uniref:uncharacterized protein n=1 Tax=Gilbertella persicaria TaxID=101096 RepID=UPI00221F4747|nr:uncharacterized protein B0P05DRAFT_580784 [Gilbertella persicaria]KAI8066958.1 hypothetical protein B0P05DRAFT_580784 [Gilbertella persicaria]
MSDIEADGLLGFDFDDEDFVTKEKEKINISQVDYDAKVETDGWFHNHDKTIDQLMLEQHGPNQVRNAIEHDYFYKRYDRLFLLRGKFYPLIGRYTEAIEAYMQYQRERKLDYGVWSGMATVFMLSAARNPTEKDMRYHLANLSMHRAIHIFTTSRWNKSIDFVKARFERDLKALQACLRETEKHGGHADQFVHWMAAGNPEKEQAGLEEFSWDDMVWIYKDWVLRQDLDLVDNDIKAVKDL